MLAEERYSGLECPKCGKRVLIERSTNQFKCLWCGFSRDVSQMEEWWMLRVAIAILALLLSAFFVYRISLDNASSPDRAWENTSVLDLREGTTSD